MTDALAPRRVRWTLAIGLMVLSPLCAEYLSGYDDSTGDPWALLGGLFIFIPLYGAPALVIRELARRNGIRRPGILALATAAGIAQAGIIDQSMFSESYRDIDYWRSMIEPTFIAPFGISAYTTLAFVAGHAVWSFGAPIALMESFSPDRRPWLRLPGLLIATGLYLAAAAVVLRWHLDGEADHASAGQIAGAGAAVLLLVVFAFTFGRRTRPPGDGRVPNPLLVGLGAMAAALAFQFAPPTWPAFAGSVALVAAVAFGVSRMARSVRWTGGHVAALATGALAAMATVAFFGDPIGEVTRTAQYAHNTVFTAGVLVLGYFAWRSGRRRS